jgi:GNAT superfamily N-acetyltransferase
MNKPLTQKVENEQTESHWSPRDDLFQDEHLYALDGYDILMGKEDSEECFWFCAHQNEGDRKAFVASLREAIGDKPVDNFVSDSFPSLELGTSKFKFETIPAHFDEAECDSGEAKICLYFFYGSKEDVKPAGFAYLTFHHDNYHKEADDIWATVKIKSVFLLKEHRGKGVAESIGAAISASSARSWLDSIETYREQNPEYYPEVDLTFEMDVVTKGGYAIYRSLCAEKETIQDLHADDMYEVGKLTVNCYDTY